MIVAPLFLFIFLFVFVATRLQKKGENGITLVDMRDQVKLGVHDPT